MIDFNEITDPEVWELFARDFLLELNFYIDSSPDRGPDGGKDLLISEEISGNLNKFRFDWLVSCKHKIVSGNSVYEADEQNILERVLGYKADGFIGFYSTLPSSGLNNRLKQLKESGHLKDYQIFDSKLIESYLIQLGFSKLLIRYFPESYKRIKPIQLIYNQYYPLNCENCGDDLLVKMFEDDANGIIAYTGKTEPSGYNIYDVYVGCKKDCQRQLENIKQQEHGCGSPQWQGLLDLANPVIFLRYVFDRMHKLEQNQVVYHNDSFRKERQVLLCIAQKVLRELNKEDRKRFDDLLEYGLV